MGYVKIALEANDQVAAPELVKQDQGAKNLVHPIHELIKWLDKTPPELVEHTYTQGPDGEKKISFTIPSRSEVAKQEAMNAAQQQQQQQQQPQGSNAVQMHDSRQEQQPLAANSNVRVKIALASKTDVVKKFPSVFVRAMGLD